MGPMTSDNNNVQAAWNDFLARH